VSRGTAAATDEGPRTPAAAVDASWIRRRWAVSRALTLLLFLAEGKILGDVRYYGRQLDALFADAGVADVLREYPAPALAVLVPPWWAALGNRVAYQVTFVVLMIAVDAAFTAALWRAGRRRPTPGVWLWIVLVPCLGPLTFARFDLVSAALAGGALLALAARRPATAGLLAAAGAAVKLWPATLLPALLVPREGRGRLLAAFSGLAAAALGLTVLLCGTTRLVSPLTWQGERGLQVESLAALPLLWGKVVSPSTWSTPYTRFYAFQVEGPWAAALDRLTTYATVAALVLLGWLWWRALRRPVLDRTGALALAGLLGVAAAALLVLTNKTLSPQYLLWIGALLAGLGCLVPDEPLLAPVGRMLVLACVLTQVTYPPLYDLLTGRSRLSAIPLTLLTVRNALLVAVAVLVVVRVVALTRRRTVPAGA
jgi:Glycosyltransferase family 87